MRNTTTRHGGKRENAGRPRTGSISMNIRIRPETECYIRNIRGRTKTLGQVVDDAFRLAIEKKDLARLLS